jgi:tetratricopeptide (TPR) repeat protein
MYLIGPLALGGYAGSKAHASLCIVMWLVLAWRLAAAGADLDESQRLWLSGRYADGIALAEKALRDGRNVEEWQLALSRSLLTVGRYEQALAVMTNALARNTRSIRLRWRAREAFLSNGKTGHADKMLEEIIALVALQPWAYRDAPNLLVFGQAALLQGADPKSVLEKLFETVRKSDPILRDGYIVSGELALDKHDFALAAQTFQEGLKKHPADPDLHLGLARAYKPSDRTLMLASAETALKLNTNHVPSLLLLGDHWIDAEDYAAADKLLARVLAVNPWHPEAWAYRALLARLRNKPAEEQAARESALRFWKTNPRVDHLIGLKLSQKYRFAEGASCQRQSLHLDKDYLLAKAQLATDLLRLGEEAQGWSLAEEVHAKDGYDVAAYNLVTLRQTMAKFNTITNQDFILRMNAHEAQVYSQLVLESLARAKNQLCAKYSLELEHPAIIEIFPEQKDFSVRTFGLPENPGYLGVCFGRVITMTSPAAHPGHPINWEAVLWHEFCHVVTL